MIRRLKWNFIAVFMAMVLVVLLGAFSLNYFSSVANLRRESEMALERLVERSTWQLSMPWDSEAEVSLPYFTLEVQRSGSIAAFMDQYYNLTTQDLSQIAVACLRQEENLGVLEQLNLRYARRETLGGWRIVCADMSFENQVQRNLIRGSALAGLMALAVFFCFSMWLASWIVRPAERAWRQQRQFVADASHELKTPLTVILSSTEMLQSRPEDEGGRLRWLENIRAEAERMRRLVEDLLCLTRLEEGRQMECVPLDFSDLTQSAVLTFEPAAYERAVGLDCSIQPGCFVLGQRDRLLQLLSILLDNCVKYCPAGGRTEIILHREPGRQLVLAVKNPGELTALQLPLLFDRFYRADPSRTGQQGYGLGLSIAAEIVAGAKGKMWADCAGGQVRFFVRLPEHKQGPESG